MAQYLKQDVQEALETAALAEFARKGLAGATVAGIARSAGVSVGNVYRYYESKQAMFDAVLPESFVTRFRGLVRRRVQAYRSGAQSNPHGMYAVASAELVAFCIEHRVRVVAVLSQDMSSPYGGFLEEIVTDLVALARMHARIEHDTPELDHQLVHIYRAYVSGLVDLLRHLEDPKTIRRCVDRYATYHLAGLEALLEKEGAR